MPTPHSLPTPSDAALIPLTSDADVLERVQVLLGRGWRHQLWLMFLDDEQRQLPLIMPTDLPRRPRDGDEKMFGRFLAELLEMANAGSVIVTLERGGTDELTDVDLRWLRLVREACSTFDVALRGPLLAHGRGVRWVAADDLLRSAG